MGLHRRRHDPLRADGRAVRGAHGRGREGSGWHRHGRAQGRGERPAGRAELLAKKRASGRMQRPAELVPIPEFGVKAP